MAEASQATTTASTPAAPPPASASAGTTGQGEASSSVLSAPPAATTAAGTSNAATTQPGSTTAPASTPDANAAAQSASAAAPVALELKVPEGFKADEKTLSSFKELAQGLKLDGPGAQKLLDLHASQVKQLEAAAAAQSVQQRKAQYQQWLDEAKADPEIGGAKWDASLASAQRALARFGGDQVLKELDAHGVGNLPGLIKLLSKVGSAIGEDTTAGSSSQGAVTDEKSALKVMFPTMFKEK